MGSRTNTRCKKRAPYTRPRTSAKCKQIRPRTNTICDMREQRTKVNDKKIAKCAMHIFFQDWKQIKRPDIPNDSFAFTAVALQRTKNHITTETRALKHINLLSS